MSPEQIPDRLRSMALSRRRLLQSVGLGGLALAAPPLLAACNSAGQPAAQSGKQSDKQVDSLRWLTTSTTALDVAKGGSSFIAACIATEPLLTLDSNLRLVGHLAESWKAVDPTTYVYTIRQGVKYWDGTPLDPEDVVFAITRQTDPKLESELAGLVPPLDSVKVTGPNEVTVRLEKPNATWQYIPTTILVAPKALMEKGKDFGLSADSIMGTGPYKVTKFRPNEVIEYVANDAYWGRRPVAKKLTIQANITDAQTSLLAMRSGSADGTFGVSAALLRDWKRLPNVTVVSAGGTNATFASFDTAVKPWDDVHLRRAFAYALDRAGLLQALLSGAGELENSLIPRAIWGGQTSKAELDAMYGALTIYDYDLAKARAELAQSAYPTGLTATLWYYQGDTMEKIALTWQQSLKQIGVTLKLEVASSEVGTDREDNHKDLGFHLNDNWGAAFPDPVSYALDLLVGSAAKAGGYNEANYKNPTVDELIRKNLTSVDPKERMQAMAQVMKMISDDVPYVPIWTRGRAVALSNTFSYTGFTPFVDANQFWINHINARA
jgi:peptide/nickel transport system substrate-binding protein